MARETKAERHARFDAELEARVALERELYPTRLMALLERVSLQGSLELTVKADKFNVYNRNNDLCQNDFKLEYAYSETAQNQLDDLTWKVESLETEAAEAQRRYEVKQSALAKLTKEERELLGL